MSREAVELAVQVGVVLVLVALVAGQILGQPILFGFVETGSMEPTIDTGDGFVAVPTALTGSPEPGDVVVFEAEEIEDGELTTHRIVEETDHGYTTQGDANPFTDQDNGEPPVQDGQIVATAWELGGEPVTIPSLGTAIMTAGSALERVQIWLATTLGIRSLLDSSGLALVLLGLSIGLYVVETIRERSAQQAESSLAQPDSSPDLDPRYLCLGFALLVVVGATAAMVVPAGTHSYNVVSADFDSEQPLVVERGTTDELTHPLPNAGYVPVISYVESGSEHVALESNREAVGPQSTGEIEVAISAPDETGYYPAYVTEYRYLHVLPASVIQNRGEYLAL
ncbi:peptidase S26 domain protein [Natrialba magadii ATCC 43099]|uniref:Peptidase S26 domain protein n=1 Tax=Natrialba magadii (strain ATCC 43099 / DSM 3394 / CCM 3739 / CIP 104546 / IAM 13178 / JCM 8861 / NBRC 102185 / NCIMB 2190 / MS3) TaxID=547559 RepID=D3SSV9_NATMM|nr:signal peptidase I [Natrialba magadii]ADD04905.1 peptidase S26 domain protein [Natrialba magadii ATCC 43099]ELY23954.1 peptidase S26B, signal peptidase [Natrialba magadii ATCC 43099]